jgi:hypothetical protein
MFFQMNAVRKTGWRSSTRCHARSKASTFSPGSKQACAET